MSDPLAKARALQELAAAKRTATFAKLQAESPDVAEFMTKINDLFGRPEAVRITFADGTTYQRGQFGRKL